MWANLLPKLIINAQNVMNESDAQMHFIFVCLLVDKMLS